MARNIFGQAKNRQANRRQEERERTAQEQAERRRRAQEAQRAALRGDEEIAWPDLDEEVIEEADEEDMFADTVVRPQSYRENDDRRRDDSQYQAIHADLQDLRVAIKDLRDQRDQDRLTMKNQESEIAQLKNALESATREANQAAQAASLNENRTRQEIDELEERLDDSMRPIRSLQGHVTDLLEQNRRKVDDTTQNKERFGEISTSMEHLTAQTDRTAAIAHGLRDSLDATRGELDELRRDILRTDDAVKIVDQDSRRRVQGVLDNLEGYNGRLDEIRSDIARSFEAIDETRRGLVHIDPSLDELRTGEQALRSDLTKLEGISDERYDQLVDVHDEMRQDTDSRFDQLRHTIEERIERLNERLEETNDTIRETTYRISELASQIEELKQQDASLHRDIWYLHEQRVRVRLEQVQEELDLATAQRRDAEGEARVGLGTRIRRRRAEDGSA